ncbi:MAG TPA: isoleucine--tRNA ligase [Nitrospiria bacterium]|nr:isoleucine--tRNA ligase [Nitrospiria bacterium]
MDYKATLNLPKTDFPMKAALSQKEPQLLAQWDRDGLYERLQRRNQNRPRYILHDGPPYANGRIHIGHALNKILKDFVVKSKAMEGFSTPYVPGWDCHGLPIEHQVLKDLGPKKQGMSQTEIRKLCRDYADRFIRIQREEFKRLGVLGDWEHPYLTMDPAYEAAIVREFGKVVKTGSVYRAKKPVLWCPNDETALAEAEVEYEDHTSPSIYVKFPVMNPEGRFPVDSKGTSVVIWTTTPWTLVANRAICLHPRFMYRLVKTPAGELILAQDLIEACMKTFGFNPGDYKIKEGAYAGRELVEDRPVLCRHPWLDLTVPLILGEHVTKDQGTGCVHTAPGHGQEDYEVGQRYGLEVYAPVDAHGRFTQEAGPFAGQKVFEANKAIITLLKDRGMLLREEAISHSYPHCWRCKKPVIFRATEQWFISMETKDLRRNALKAIDDDVTWIPKWGRDRIFGMIENRPDWCISRQRAWGVPIVAFACADCKALLFTPEVVNHVADRMEREGGSDIWFTKSADDLLPKGTVCPKCEGGRFSKENDILDVWFESGVSHAAVLRRRPELTWPADLYLEGSDQHRGWFHSALLTSLLTEGRPPYKAVLTHGFVVDGSGKKMSKSAGNVVAPQEVIEKNGAEILRLWIAATDFREDVRISQEILSHQIEAYRKIRNTCRFLLGNLYDFDPKRDSVPDEQLHEIDRWALHRLQGLIRRVRQGYAQFEFHTVFHALNNFCAVDLSAIYLDILKDRLYSDPAASISRRAAQGVLFETLTVLTRLMAPILSFTAEEIWGQIPRGFRDEDSVHLGLFPTVKEAAVDPSLEARWEKLLSIREEVAKALEAKRNEKAIGASQDAKVRLWASGELHDFLLKHEPLLGAVFIVSKTELKSFESGNPNEMGFVSGVLPSFGVSVSRSDDPKCGRCWYYRDTVGKNSRHPSLCARCAEAVG